jgi:hypothetical protein
LELDNQIVGRLKPLPRKDFRQPSVGYPGRLLSL